jgi:hypothetical protein
MNEFEKGRLAQQEIEWARKAIGRYTPVFDTIVGVFAGLVSMICLIGVLQDGRISSDELMILFFPVFFPAGILCVLTPFATRDTKRRAEFAKQILRKYGVE